jgi:hypothetical protein
MKITASVVLWTIGFLILLLFPLSGEKLVKVKKEIKEYLNNEKKD